MGSRAECSGKRDLLGKPGPRFALRRPRRDENRHAEREMTRALGRNTAALATACPVIPGIVDGEVSEEAATVGVEHRAAR